MKRVWVWGARAGEGVGQGCGIDARPETPAAGCRPRAFSTPVVLAVPQIPGRVVAVHDGDTITVPVDATGHPGSSFLE